MRKIVIGMHTGYCGMDSWEFYEVPDDVTDTELNDFAWDLAKQHAESFGIYPTNEFEGTDEEWEEVSDSYSYNIDGWFEEYNPEKHDRHRAGNDNYWNNY